MCVSFLYCFHFFLNLLCNFFCRQIRIINFKVVVKTTRSLLRIKLIRFISL